MRSGELCGTKISNRLILPVNCWRWNRPLQAIVLLLKLSFLMLLEVFVLFSGQKINKR